MLRSISLLPSCNIILPIQTTTRNFAKKSVSPLQSVLRPIHFEHEKDDTADRPFRIIGVRDVEVLDWEYPTRLETDEKNKNRVLRNRFGSSNFISLWIDKLDEVESYLKQQKVPYASEGIVKGPDGHDVLVIPPSDDGSSIEFFNLCDNPTMVELVQATPEIIKEYVEDNEEIEGDEDLEIERNEKVSSLKA
ncbi:unnamed protein product [Peronospora belbahrii]|uniref:VOC domain-containing protein n=1 Tax=Peronospora belbahrii TaxID=622444 RepID=A0AAU9KRY7_9STRA|nr:unnamed protein product [Peronospora belbahrii]CAH0521542.1 unnamed protein product [Peronospora belbahrii]